MITFIVLCFLVTYWKQILIGYIILCILLNMIKT